MKPYPAYKDSGVESIGEIPEHWELKPLKYLLRDGKEGIKIGPFGSSLKLEIMKDTGYKVYGQENIIKNDFSTGKRFIDENKFLELKVYEINENDIIITMMGTTGKSKVVPKGIDAGIMDSHLIRLKCKDSVNPDFISLLINDSDYISIQVRQNGKGAIMEGLNSSIIKSLTVLTPYKKEQDWIINFLNHKFKLIDTLIGKKQRQIELLKEQRAATVNQAVTKGLDPNVKMKDSGIKWLGEMPEHWAVAPVYSRYSVQLGKMLDSKKITGQFLVPYLRNVDVQWDRIDVDNLPEMDIQPEERKRYGIIPGDLIVCEGGEVGRAAIWEGAIKECYYQKALHRLRPLDSQESPRFMYYLLYTAANRGLFKATGNPNTIDHLTAEQLRRHRFPFPPGPEQDLIANRLDETCIQTDRLIDKIVFSINLLYEYRTTLISDVVTGKIDVRDEVIP